MSIRNNYNHTLNACYTAYAVQAIVNHFVPLLFVMFQDEFGIPVGQITLLVTVNFTVQLLIDFASAAFVDRIGYKTSIMMAHMFVVLGLVGLGTFPQLFSTPFTGLLISVILYALGGGLIEVLLSPIVASCPTERKSVAISILYSFYCWGVESRLTATTPQQ